MKKLLIFSIVLIGLLACQKEKTDSISPYYLPASGDFNVTNFIPSTSSVDFTKETVMFNANFTSKVTWILTITGQASGAIHQIRGTSDGLNDVEWSGEIDGVQFFREGETVRVTLAFYGTTFTQSLDITITKTPKFTACGYFAIGAGFDTPYGTVPSTGWNGFNLKVNGDTNVFNVRQGVAVENYVNTLRTDRNGNLVKAPQGNGYYYIVGKGDQSVFVSGVGFGSYMPASKGMYKNLPSDPNEVWVNVYLYGSGDPNAQAQLEFQEASPNNDYYGAQPDPTTDNFWEAYVPLTHTGWKLFSFKYSSLTPSLDGNFGSNGTKVHEPNKLWGFAVMLVKKTNPDLPVELFMDYPIITVGGPFNPGKPCSK